MYLATALNRKKSSVKDISIYSYKETAIKNGELPKELYEFEALESLYISADIKSISPAIGKLKNLTSLTIKSDILTKLPKEIGLLKNLTYLSISGKKINSLPDTIAQLSNLNSLNIWNTNLKAIPTAFSLLPNLTLLDFWRNENLTDLKALNNGFDKLERLFIRDCNIKNEYLDPIYSLSQLTHLNLNDNKIESISEKILVFNQLKNFHICNNTLTEIPIFIKELKTLRFIDFSSNKIKVFPSCLKELPTLQKIKWNNNLLGEYSPELLAFDISAINPYDLAEPRRKFEAFLHKIKQCNWSPLQLELFFLIRNNQALSKNSWNRSDFLTLLQFEDKTFPVSLVEKLLVYEQKLIEKKPLDNKSELVIIGKTNIKKTAIKAALKEQKISYQSKISSNTTHLLLGTGLKVKDFELLHNLHYTLISPQVFQEYMNDWTKPYLLDEEAEHSLEQIANLLLSQETDNQILGLELLKGGGVPKELLTELFIVYKFCKDKKAAQNARKMIIKNASPNLLESIKQRINLGTIKASYNTNNKIELLTNNTELETWKIAQYAYRFNPKIWQNQVHLGIKDAPLAEAKDFLRFVISKETKDNYHYNAKSLLNPYLPMVFEIGATLKSIRLEKLQNIPTEITQLQSLESLDIALCNDFEFPDEIQKLPSLKTIHFYNSSSPHWDKILNQIAGCPKLDQLRFGNTMKSGIHPSISQMDKIKSVEFSKISLQKKDLKHLSKMANLEEAIFDNAYPHLNEDFLLFQHIKSLRFFKNNYSIYQLTPRINELKNLKELHLSGPVDLPEQLNELTNLEVLSINFTYNRPHPIIPQNISNLTNLKTLHIKGQIDDIESCLSQLQKLEYLELNNFKIDSDFLLELIGKFKHLKTFKRYLKPNDLTIFQSQYPNIEFIN